MAQKQATILKLCLMGEGGVGKSTLCNRIITGLFNPTTKMTIGIDFQMIKLDILDPTADEPDTIHLDIQIWDFGGEDRFRFMLPRFVKGACGGLLMYDLTRFSTRKYLPEWLDIWNSNADQEAPIYLIGTKFDNVGESEKTMVIPDAKEISESLNIKKYFITSSKSGYSVDSMLDSIVKDMYIFKMTKKDIK